MDMQKDEIVEALNHQRKVVRALRQRLQQRELHEAIHGINTQPEIINEIHDLNERIVRHEREIDRLQTLAVEDKIPLAEAEYRVALALAWDSGRLTTIGSTNLELTRLQLGITSDRSRSLEYDIRKHIARDRLAERDRSEIILRVREQLSYFHSPVTGDREDLLKGICQTTYAHLSQLHKAIDLDAEVVVNWMNEDTELALSPDEIDLLIDIVEKHKDAKSGCKLIQFLDFLGLLRKASHL